MTEEKILDRVKKLLALGQSSNPHESASALAMAQKLMADHNLTEGKILLSEITHVDIRSQASVSKMKAHELGLMSVVAVAFGCEVLWNRRHSSSADNWGRYTLVGSKTQIPVAEYTANVMLRKMMKARNEFVGSLPADLDRVSKTREADGFCLGWVLAVKKVVHAFSGQIPTLAIEEYKKNEFNMDGTMATSQDRKIGQLGYMNGLKVGAGESILRPMAEGEKARQLGRQLKIGKD